MSNFTLPAEYRHHTATWLAWPHNKSDWPGKFSAIPFVYAEIVKQISYGEKVRIIVESKDDFLNPDQEIAMQKYASKIGVAPKLNKVSMITG